MNYQEAKILFHEFYSKNEPFLRSAEGFFRALCESIISDDGFSIHHMSSRVKTRESSLDKFDKRYRTQVETDGADYQIKDKISDLIGVRIICFYEKDVLEIANLLEKTLGIYAPRKDRFLERDSSPNEFGYRAIHLNLNLNEDRSNLAEYRRFSTLSFEVQIRTVIQDAWSVLDHQLQYKGHASSKLKRSINALAAVFEQADQNFAQIRGQVDAEQEEARKKMADTTEINSPKILDARAAKIQGATEVASEPIDVISLNELMKNIFPEFNGSLPGVARLLDDIGPAANNLSLTSITDKLKSELPIISDYEKTSEKITNLSPLTKLRHSLYASDRATFKTALFDYQRTNFENWLQDNKLPTTP